MCTCPQSIDPCLLDNELARYCCETFTCQAHMNDCYERDDDEHTVFRTLYIPHYHLCESNYFRGMPATHFLL